MAEFERAVGELGLAPGDPVPSVRTLAQCSGLAPGTIATAMAALRRRRTVVTRDRSGSVIAMALPSDGPSGVYLPAGTVDLAGGWPDPTLLPELGPVLARLARSDGPRAGYGPPALDPGLEDWWRARLVVPGSSVTVTSGALDAVDRALSTSLRHGDRVAVEDPGYPPLLRVLRAQGLQPVAVSIDDEGFVPAALRAALGAGVEAVVCTPQAQNPTGARLGAPRAAALRRVLRGHDVLVVEDDHLGLLAPEPESLAGTTRRWLVARSVSKALGPDLRVALVAGDADTVSALALRLQAGPGWVSHLLQRVVLALLTDRSTDTVLRRALATYDARRRALLAALAAEGVTAQGASGMNVWVPVADETATCLALADAGYAVAPGSPYRLVSPPAVRVTTAVLDEADAPAVAAAVARAPI